MSLADSVSKALSASINAGMACGASVVLDDAGHLHGTRNEPVLLWENRPSNGDEVVRLGRLSVGKQVFRSVARLPH